MTIWIAADSAAGSVGADRVAQVVASEASRRGLTIDIKRPGSRGAYWLEPLVEVTRGGVRYGFGPVSAADVPGLFDANFLTRDDHDLALGPVEDIDFLARQTRVLFRRNGIIEPCDFDQYAGEGGWRGLAKAFSMTAGEVIETMKQSGLRGRGGAGFPAAIKWATVAAQADHEKYVVCNADEGDSGTFADRMMMEGDPFRLIEGMIIAAYAIGASQGYIYIRSEYPDAIACFTRACKVARERGVLGPRAIATDGGRSRFDIEIRRGAGAYICGEESSMLDSLEGKRGMVRSKPPIPAISGLFGKPTLVHNVLSLGSVPDILAFGSAAYAALGVGRSTGTQAFQLAGNIRRGGLIELEFGVTLRSIIEDFGGGTRSGLGVRAVQLGGPLGAYIPKHMLDVSMDYEALAEAGAMLGHGGIVVFDDTVDMAEQARFAFHFCAIESCGKCTPCRVGSVRGRELMDKIIAGKDIGGKDIGSKDIGESLIQIEELAEIMVDGSLCAMGGLTPMPVRSAIKYFPQDFAPK